MEANDPFWPALTAAVRAAKADPAAWLGQRHIYGDLAGDPRFADAFSRWLRLIHTKGMVAAIEAYVNG